VRQPAGGSTEGLQIKDLVLVLEESSIDFAAFAAVDGTVGQQARDDGVQVAAILLAEQFEVVADLLPLQGTLLSVLEIDRIDLLQRSCCEHGQPNVVTLRKGRVHVLRIFMSAHRLL
jgi:hypothetical protein